MGTDGPEATAAHEFGGAWTTEKLDVLSRYLSSYAKALKNQPSPDRPFIRGYIDAFAGSGTRQSKRLESQGLLDEPAAALLDGSARMALRTEPPFDRYVFIEQSRGRCRHLEALKQEFPALAENISVRNGEANEEIQALCARNWRNHRAVLFLDPYGMQVKWKTIEAIASTKAIDLWVLFPLGVAVNRLVVRSGKIPTRWRESLDELLGTTDWFEEFYTRRLSTNLFGDEVETLTKASTETIGKYFVKRLASIFAAVAPQPKVLRNATRNPLYLLCFAAGNARGAEIAVRIANYLVKKGTS